MNYELRDDAIYPIKNVNQAAGKVLRCPGCGCIDLCRVDDMVDSGAAFQCAYGRCRTIYQVYVGYCPYIEPAEEGTEVAT